MLQECPVCNWKPIKGDECPQCKTSLAPLLRVIALPQMYFEEGARLLEAGQVDEAIVSLAVAASHEHPQRVAACAALGRAYAQKGWHREALREFDRALQLDPADERARKAREETARAMELREQEENKRQARARRWAYLAPAAFLLGLAIFPAGQKLFSSQPAASEAMAAVTRAIEAELGSAREGMVVVSAAEDGKMRLAGAVPAELQARIVRAAEEHVGAGRVDASALTALAPPPAPSPVVYRVRRGDSLWKIARRIYGESRHWKLLYEHNRERLRDPRRLPLGQELIVPPNPKKARD
jgi:tetratricopeptide (TPR) repeat protein